MATTLLPSYDRLISHIVEKWSPEEILAFQVSDEEQERAEYLLDQNNEGRLTSEEYAELQQMLHFDRLVSLFKAKAAYALSE
jgi:hypothetical protein